MSNAKSEKIWSQITGDLQHRHAALLADIKAFDEYKIADEAKLYLSATDVFVEKAQHELTRKGNLLAIVGVVSIVSALIIMCVAFYYILTSTPAEILGYNNLPSNIPTGVFGIAILKSISASGFALGAVVVCMYMARASFHESTVSFNRRHALRFGRLFIYLKQGQGDFDELERAFRWNEEFSTAFRDVKPESFSKTLFHEIASLPEKLVEAFKENKPNTNESKPGN